MPTSSGPDRGIVTFLPLSVPYLRFRHGRISVCVWCMGAHMAVRTFVIDPQTHREAGKKISTRVPRTSGRTLLGVNSITGPMRLDPSRVVPQRILPVPRSGRPSPLPPKTERDVAMPSPSGSDGHSFDPHIVQSTMQYPNHSGECESNDSWKRRKLAYRGCGLGDRGAGEPVPCCAALCGTGAGATLARSQPQGKK